MEPTSSSSNTGRMMTRLSAKKLVEMSRDQVRKEIDRCLKEEIKYTRYFDVAWKHLDKGADMLIKLSANLKNFVTETYRMLIEMILNRNEKINEIMELRTSLTQGMIISTQHFGDLCSQALNNIQVLVSNLERTTRMLSSLQSRVATMTLEDANNIVYPDYLWAENNFHPNHYILEDSGIEICAEIDRKLKICEESVIKLNEENEIRTNSEPSQSTSQN